jgi:hypothetical protein
MARRCSQRSSSLNHGGTRSAGRRHGKVRRVRERHRAHPAAARHAYPRPGRRWQLHRGERGGCQPATPRCRARLVRHRGWTVEGGVFGGAAGQGRGLSVGAYPCQLVQQVLDGVRVVKSCVRHTAIPDDVGRWSSPRSHRGVRGQKKSSSAATLKIKRLMRGSRCGSAADRQPGPRGVTVVVHDTRTLA